MDTLDLFREAARRFGRVRFVERYQCLFFVKAPSVLVSRGETQGAERAPIEFHTTGLPSVLRGPGIDPAHFASEWRVAEIKKREGNPFPDRIGIGRAQNCDVVLRVPSVSKLHAHVLVDPQNGLRLVDLKSANGTSLNGVALVPHEPSPIATRDRVKFGALEVEIADAERLFELVTTEAQHA